MENKKGIYNNTNAAKINEPPVNTNASKHLHQHPGSQNLRLLQYGLKVPNHSHSQFNQLHKQQIPHTHSHIHQHQVQNHYQQSHNYNQIPLVHQHVPPNLQKKVEPLHPHSKVNRQNAQLWVPQQIPLYHQQQYQQMQHHQPQSMQQPQHVQLHVQQPHPQQMHQQNILPQQNQPPAKKDAQPQPQTAAKPNSLPTKTKESEKKKSNHIQLRSPTAKRPPEAPVTMQGWLYKQGSEGLMLWKKRWFVLSEYCFFYYKGPEEERLLGSILLPSYKVSICGPEDKVNKKYAFKCEHTNMRTYVLAADSQELMMQWIRVLNLACMLQLNMEKDVQTPNSGTSSADKNSIAYHQQQNSRTTPVQMFYANNNNTEMSTPSLYSQPLYANAPPKPRRLNDGSYSSPSPDLLDRYPNDPKYYMTPQYDVPPNLRNITKSPSISNSNMTPQEYMQLHPQTPVQNIERRTPDTYGRSKLTPNKHMHPSDYEDIYAEQCMYKRPLSPLAYTNKKPNPVVTPVVRPFTPVAMVGPRDMRFIPPEQRRKSPSSIPRPHSADFLEYESNQANSFHIANRQPRPKSSLDVNAPNDNYFYSEQRYADKMRKSAQYLSPRMPSAVSFQNQYALNQQKRNMEHENTFPLMRSSTQPFHYNNTYSEAKKESFPMRSRSVLSEGSLSKELDSDMHFNKLEQYDSRCDISPGPLTRQEQMHGYQGNYSRKAEYDQFTRAASARLSHNLNEVKQMQADPKYVAKEGDRKREESMKRLLEWKQRMLQSPLNRKVYQNSSKGYNTYYKTHDNGYSQKLHEVPYDSRSYHTLPQYNSYSSDDEASGSISINTRDNTFPKAISAKRIWTPNSQHFPSKSYNNVMKPHESDYAISNRVQYSLNQPAHKHESLAARKGTWQWDGKMNMSAGELLGRTHEELVLLLIQLRRQSTNICHAIETGYNEIDSIQAQLHLMDVAKRLENLNKLEQIKQHLLELEKQYEKGKPLVNLVDSMVKLGSLYHKPVHPNNSMKDRLEFNQKIQERRLLAEEKRDWHRVNPNHAQLQEKVQQLYQLDQLIHEESGTLQNLQQDKEEIERALTELQHKLAREHNDPLEIELAKKQQAILENELSRVHLMLAQNSKKLEETVAGNAKLEQELLVLKQKLQLSRQHRNSPQFSNAGDSLPCVVGSSAILESDLQRVQQKVNDLQKQRQELSMQVKQLTDRSNNLQTNIKQPLQNQGLNNKKKMHSSWRETDLDTLVIIDHGDSWDMPQSSTPTSPLYINTDFKHDNDYKHSIKSVDSSSDDTPQNSNFMPQEKQASKTVRIVKRESERRQRDREKTVTGKCDPLFEEDDANLLFKTAPVQKATSSSNIEALSPTAQEFKESMLSRQNSLSSPSLQKTYTDQMAMNEQVNSYKSPELSPVFKSEAARQIITEMSMQETPKNANRRAVPKEKRRHHTAPHNNLIMKSLNQLNDEEGDLDKLTVIGRRARDDLDMERALRQRIDTPDVVRSTLSNKEVKYNESTIDNLLGTPNKISIPERYIPEQLPQLSAEEQEHRLRKVESIKKMLSDSAILSSSCANLADATNDDNSTKSILATKATSKIIEEKKQREHLLQLNQILARQVMEMSKIVAGSTNSSEQ